MLRLVAPRDAQLHSESMEEGLNLDTVIPCHNWRVWILLSVTVQLEIHTDGGAVLSDSPTQGLVEEQLLI